VTLDLGPASDAKYIVVEWERIGGSNADQTLYARGHDFQDPASGSGSPEDAFSFTLNGGASGTSQGGFTTARRYLSVFMYRNGAGGTYGSDFQVRLNAVRVFADAAWVSGGASVLHASDVLRDALTRATLLLSSDWSQIQDTSFAIPEFAPDSDRTPREIATAVNALHDWLIQVTADARPVFRPKPTDPVVEIGAWPGSSFEDASANSGDEIYDQVRVTGQDAASNRLRVTRSQTGTLVDRRGFHHTKTPAHQLLADDRRRAADRRRLADRAPHHPAEGHRDHHEGRRPRPPRRRGRPPRGAAAQHGGDAAPQPRHRP
jgi:hypothetical protein